MRVTMSKSEAMAQSLRGLRIFKPTPGTRSRIVFPVDENGQEYMFAVPVHQINLGRIRGKARCLKDYFPEGTTLETVPVDPVSGKKKWDGTCPYCALGITFSKIRNMRMEEYREANPEATEKEQKEYFKELSKNQPAGVPELLRGFLVAVIQMDPTGVNPVLVDGEPAFDIMFLPMTENQYSKKFKGALFEVDGKIDFTELQFAYPDGDKMTSAKDMTMSLTTRPVMTPKLKQAIIDKIKEIDVNTVEDKVLTFRPETLADVERKLAPVQNQLTSDLSPEEREKLANEIEQSMVRQ